MQRPRLLAPALSALLLAAHALPAADQRPPNVVVIMTDDQGYADAGFNGCTDIPTPHMDRIAAGGVVFTDGYAPYVVCAPSRAGFITGRYPQRFGFERNVAYRPNDPTAGIAVEEVTLAQALRPRGYRSSVVGKWHLGAHANFHPLNRGFDEFFGHLGGGHRYFPEELDIERPEQARNEPESYRTWIQRGFEPVRTQRYLTDEFTEEALQFIRRSQSGPFFLYLAYNAPHAPLQAPEEDIRAFAHIPDQKRRIYAAMLTRVDRGVGRLLDLLAELKLEENTLVFYLSDNGGPIDANGSSNAPLRGRKSDVWEGGHRVPFAARWPGKFPAGMRYSEPVSSLDIFATVAAANGIESDPARPLDGVDLLPFLRGERKGPPHDRLFLRKFDEGTYALREGDFKIVKPKDAPSPRLFNLREDIAERRNLADTDAARVEAMRAAYEAWNSQLIPPAFPGLDMREWAQPAKAQKPEPVPSP